MCFVLPQLWKSLLFPFKMGIVEIFLPVVDECAGSRGELQRSSFAVGLGSNNPWKGSKGIPGIGLNPELLPLSLVSAP